MRSVQEGMVFFKISMISPDRQSSFFPASGKKSGVPNLSTPKTFMILCASFV
jgi:hypothetical protein